MSVKIHGSVQPKCKNVLLAVNLYASQKLQYKLIHFFNNFFVVCLQIHCNAAQSLCDIVRLGREQMMQMQDSSDPDPLLTTMEL